jgi:hypothetical protein
MYMGIICVMRPQIHSSMKIFRILNCTILFAFFRKQCICYDKPCILFRIFLEFSYSRNILFIKSENGIITR